MKKIAILLLMIVLTGCFNKKEEITIPEENIIEEEKEEEVKDTSNGVFKCKVMKNEENIVRIEVTSRVFFEDYIITRIVSAVEPKIISKSASITSKSFAQLMIDDLDLYFVYMKKEIQESGYNCQSEYIETENRGIIKLDCDLTEFDSQKLVDNYSGFCYTDYLKCEDGKVIDDSELTSIHKYTQNVLIEGGVCTRE